MLEELMHAAVARATTSEAIAKRIDEQAQKAVAIAVEQALSAYGPFGEALKAKLQEALPTVLDEFNFATFTATVNEILKRRLANMADKRFALELEALFSRLLGDDKRVISFKDLADAFREDYYKHESAANGSHFTMETERSDRRDGFFDLWIDPKAGANEYGAKYLLRCRDDKTPGEIEVWGLTIHGKTYESSLFNGPLFGFDAMIFRLYTGVARLKETSYETHWSNDCHCG